MSGSPTACRTSQAAPLPGVLILTSTPPLNTPTLLLSSHIRHPLKDTYPRLLAEHWVSHVSAQQSRDEVADSVVLAPVLGNASAMLCEPIAWLPGVPSFPSHSDDDDGDDEADEDASGSQGEVSSDEDDGANVWRGMKKQARQAEKAARVYQSASETVDAPQGTFVANLTVGQVTYLAPIPTGTNPLLALAFLHHLHSVLLQYFPSTSAAASSSSGAGNLATYASTTTPIPAATLSSNFDLLYQVLQEMLDDGRPLTTDYNSLKGIVRGKLWWEDLLSRMSHLTSAAPAPPPQISPLPWRPAGVRYSRNEMYVDIVETLTGVMDRKGKSVAGLNLSVCIACRARLTGSEPDLTLALHPPPRGPSSTIVDPPAFHACVRTRKWVKEGLLSFVPPDGDFELARFGIAPVVSKLGGGSTGDGSGAWDKDVPFTVQAQRHADKELKGREWTFEIRLTSKTSTGAESIEVCFYVDSNAASRSMSSSSDAAGLDLPGMHNTTVEARTAVSSRSAFGSGGSGSGAASSSQDEAGSWRYDEREGILYWTIPKLGATIGGPSEVVLKGTVTNDGQRSTAALPQPSSILTTFSLPTGSKSLSGLRVAQLQIHHVDYQPFKGVRGATRGKLEWRW